MFQFQFVAFSRRHAKEHTNLFAGSLRLFKLCARSTLSIQNNLRRRIVCVIRRTYTSRSSRHSIFFHGFSYASHAPRSGPSLSLSPALDDAVLFRIILARPNKFALLRKIKTTKTKLTVSESRCLIVVYEL